MDTEEIKKEFDKLKGSLTSLEGEAKFILDAALKKQKIKIHSMPSRVKEFESFLDKARRKHTTNPFEDIRDMVGLRWYCLFLSDIPRVGQV
jgi:putative GTP pyrophosphokinase